MSGDPMSSMSGARGGDPDEVEGESPVERVLRRAGWVPSLNFRAHLRRAGIDKDADVADAMLDELLAIEPTPEAREEALRFLRDVRGSLGLADGDLLAPRYSEHALRRLAHLILSLPEANLH